MIPLLQATLKPIRDSFECQSIEPVSFLKLLDIIQIVERKLMTAVVVRH